MRPIDADVAIEELTDRSHQAAKRVGTDSPFWEGLVIARRIVNNLPTIQPEPKEELLDDGTLVLWTSCDMTKVSRVNVRQTGTHYGDLYYPDED